MVCKLLLLLLLFNCARFNTLFALLLLPLLLRYFFDGKKSEIYISSTVILRVSIYYCYLKSFIRLHCAFFTEKKGKKLNIWYIFCTFTLFTQHGSRWESQIKRCTQNIAQKNQRTNILIHKHFFSTIKFPRTNKQINIPNKFNSNFPFQNVCCPVFSLLKRSSLKFFMKFGQPIQCTSLKIAIYSKLICTKNRWKVLGKKLRFHYFQFKFQFPFERSVLFSSKKARKLASLFNWKIHALRRFFLNYRSEKLSEMFVRLLLLFDWQNIQKTPNFLCNSNKQLNNSVWFLFIIRN